MRAWDTSNYLTPRADDNPQGFRDFLARSRDLLGLKIVFVQGINPPPRYPKSQTAAQCEAVLATEGLLLGGYVYPFFDSGVSDIYSRLATLAPYKDDMVALALDLEDTTSGLPWETKADITDGWLGICDQFTLDFPEPQTGIYTGEGVWDGIRFPRDLNRWANRWCWWASYVGAAFDINAEPDIAQSQRLVTRGGFTDLVMRQYLGSRSAFGGYTGFDANVVLEGWVNEVLMTPQVGTDVGDDYWAKFGPEGNNTLADRFDWPSVAKNLEGIISTVQQQAVQADVGCEQAIQGIKDSLRLSGYL